MNLRKTVDPSVEPITLAQARLWCGFQTGVTADDDALTALIAELRGYLEARLTGRKLITQTWTVELDAAEVDTIIPIPLLPLQTATVKVTDTAGAQTTLDASNYQVRAGENPRIVLAPSGAWGSMRTFDSMLITCVVGYGLQADLPDDIVMLLKGLVQHQYRSKGLGINETVSGQLISVPGMFERQIKALKVDPWA